MKEELCQHPLRVRFWLWLWWCPPCVAVWGQVCPSDRDCWCKGGTSPVRLISVSPRICTSGRFDHISQAPVNTQPHRKVMGHVCGRRGARGWGDRHEQESLGASDVGSHEGWFQQILWGVTWISGVAWNSCQSFCGYSSIGFMEQPH